MNILEEILSRKIIAIFRGIRPNDVLPIAEALYAGGIRAVEITLNSENAFEVISSVSEKLGDKLLVGAGTVLDAGSAQRAIDNGAKYIISPSTDADTIKVTRDNGMVSMPGALTPTEIVTAHNLGADIVKVFPASTPAYIRELRGPLSHIKMIPTGGINKDNIQEYAKAGAAGFGIGSSLVKTSLPVTEEYLAQITGNARELVRAIQIS